MKAKQYTILDRGILMVDAMLDSLFTSTDVEHSRVYPAEQHVDTDMNEGERKHTASLMRVNHAGEVAAQALYKAQALTARDPELKKTMQQSANEEIDHLHWCQLRLNELDDRCSYLVPVWHIGSFGIGLIAGFFGDKWNLGFLAETEYQVVQHLDSHLQQVPEEDKRSRAILEQMRKDELKHAVSAEESGAKTLPDVIKRLMRISSKVMTKTAYRL